MLLVFHPVAVIPIAYPRIFCFALRGQELEQIRLTRRRKARQELHNLLFQFLFWEKQKIETTFFGQRPKDNPLFWCPLRSLRLGVMLLLGLVHY